MSNYMEMSDISEDSRSSSARRPTIDIDHPPTRRRIYVSMAAISTIAIVCGAIALGLHYSDGSKANQDPETNTANWVKSSSDAEPKTYTNKFTSTNKQHAIDEISLTTPNTKSTFVSGTRQTVYDTQLKPLYHVDTEIVEDLVFGNLATLRGDMSPLHLRVTITDAKTGAKGVLVPMSDTLLGNTTQPQVFYVEYGTYRNIVDFSAGSSLRLFLNSTGHPGMVNFFNHALQTYIKIVGETRNSNVQSAEMMQPQFGISCGWDCGFDIAKLVWKCYKAYDQGGLNIMTDYGCISDAWKGGKTCVCCVTHNRYSVCH